MSILTKTYTHDLFGHSPHNMMKPVGYLLVIPYGYQMVAYYINSPNLKLISVSQRVYEVGKMFNTLFFVFAQVCLTPVRRQVEITDNE